MIFKPLNTFHNFPTLHVRDIIFVRTRCFYKRIYRKILYIFKNIYLPKYGQRRLISY